MTNKISTRHRHLIPRALLPVLIVPVLFLLFAPYRDACAEEAAPSRGQEGEFLIVKYGTVDVKSSLPEAMVYIDGESKGPANTAIENVIAGEHTITCTAGEKSVTGKFTVRKNETLKLEARFSEGRIVVLAVMQEDAAKKKREAEAARPEQQKKKAETEAKKPEGSPIDERRALHLNVFRVEFKDLNAQDVAINEKMNAKIISGYTERKNRTGKYYRTKQGLLLCEEGACVQEWIGKFIYTDETGKRDSFLVTWKQTTFSGMTPTGTNGRELTWCLNGNCKKMTDTGAGNAPYSAELGRYVLRWSKEAVIIRRADIIKEILDGGGTVPE